jgi:pre-mRNA-splicing factor CDC5/CEF1
LEGKRRDEEEEAKRKIDQRRMKKLKDRELD